MLLKSLENLESFEAGDKTNIIEVLHPKNDNIPLGYSLAHASLDIGKSSLPHILKECSEVYYILKGKGKMVIGEQGHEGGEKQSLSWEERLVKKGDTVFIPAGATQYVENQGDTSLEFLCIVSPAWYEEQEEIN
ncbi:MAG: mannose-6-phosphate isomerase-like protein (cupin superfamily) [Saprospiraceae bacterium]|jgi:mannose-6-phosphate isomerase-like protein (cupin superfamily)